MGVVTNLDLAPEEVPEPLRRRCLHVLHARVSRHCRRQCSWFFLFFLFENMFFQFGELELPLEGFEMHLLLAFVYITEV